MEAAAEVPAIPLASSTEQEPTGKARAAGLDNSCASTFNGIIQENKRVPSSPEVKGQEAAQWPECLNPQHSCFSEELKLALQSDRHLVRSYTYTSDDSSSAGESSSSSTNLAESDELSSEKNEGRMTLWAGTYRPPDASLSPRDGEEQQQSCRAGPASSSRARLAKSSQSGASVKWVNTSSRKLPRMKKCQRTQKQKEQMQRVRRAREAVIRRKCTPQWIGSSSDGGSSSNSELDEVIACDNGQANQQDPLGTVPLSVFGQIEWELVGNVMIWRVRDRVQGSAVRSVPLLSSSPPLPFPLNSTPPLTSSQLYFTI
uniref:protein ARK2N-like n=1 Tax=Pristiophorus japonicus TaxID=55135 RepID=UPI00398F3464